MEKGISAPTVFLIAAAVSVAFFSLAIVNFSAPNEVGQQTQEKLTLIASGRMNCNADSMRISILNMNDREIPTDSFVLRLDGSPVACKESPSVAATNGFANCTITGFSVNEYHSVEVFTKSSDLYFHIAFLCPTVLTDRLTATASVVIPPENTNRNASGFSELAGQRGILLVGMNKSANETYYFGFDPDNESVDLDKVPNWWVAESGLEKIPDKILQTMKGKTVYMSVKPGRGYTMATPFLKGTTAGFILEQTITELQAVHELGHIVDFTGVKTQAGDESSNIFAAALSERNRIFKVTEPYNPNASSPPKGFIDVYSSANDAESFAQHFAHYVLYADEFRQKMQNDSLLKEKYDFFKKWIFDGKEY